MIEVYFIIGLAFVWIAFASMQDILRREVANWLNFSLIIFALGFRFFWGLFSGEGFFFFYQGIVGLALFFLIAHAFYYARVFAGGDAKLMISLGAILPLSISLFDNLLNYALFLLIFFFVGAVYGFVFSMVLSFKHFSLFKKEFVKLYRKKKMFVYLFLSLGIIFACLGFVEIALLPVGVILFVLPYFYIYAKALDQAAMIKKVKVKDLREGDWLYKDVDVGDNLVKVKWDGLTLSQIEKIKKHHKFIHIREGIPFVPVFLISYILFWIAYFAGWFYLI